MNTAKATSVVIDAYSDPALQQAGVSGSYSRFTNTLSVPVLNAKSVQLKHASFVNSLLQLNDNSQLMFWFLLSTSQTPTRNPGTLRCIRLHPSDFIAFPGYTAFVRNRYFNSVPELIAALNAAASSGGDDINYNPYAVINAIQFAYDSTTRKVSLIPQAANTYIVPLAADDPLVLEALSGNNGLGRIRMNTYPAGSVGAAPLQPFVSGVSMNARLGFAMSFGTRGKYWGANSKFGCATSTGVPFSNTEGSIEADAPPILLASQNINIYASIVNGSGQDAKTQRRNLLATIPVQVAPLNVSVFQGDYVGVPCITGVPQEMQQIEITLLDDYGQPFPQPSNFNFQLTLGVEY